MINFLLQLCLNLPNLPSKIKLMAQKKSDTPKDNSTEEKIKAAARKVFHQKGYAGTRTRDIAEEAGMNLALLNYYFKSKDKLFQIIMFETLYGFMSQLAFALNDDQTSIEQKAEIITAKYIDFILEEPEVPLFIMNEMRTQGEDLFEKFPAAQIIMQSAFIRQYREAVEQGKITEPNPLHFIMNLLGMVVFPFIARPLMKRMGNLRDKEYEQLMQDRKKKIPHWIKIIMNS